MNTASNSANPDTSLGYGVINVVDAINYSYEMKLDEKITTVMVLQFQKYIQIRLILN